VGFVVDKMALGQVFSEYFGFPWQFSFHRLLHTHHLSFGAGTIGQLVADVPSGLSLTPPQETKRNNNNNNNNNPEDHSIHFYRRENLRSCILMTTLRVTKAQTPRD
jgi:hypothetical protein